MTILTTAGWPDYELIDSGHGYRLERFGKYILKRPDPQILWKPKLSENEWNKADAVFNDRWIYQTSLPQKWVMTYKNIFFWVKPTRFKHTGVFPEQSPHWDFIQNKINSAKHSVNILNLFAYTGVASLIALSAGAKVTHVDASKPSTSWAKENQQISGLSEKAIRYMLDDVIDFCKREIRRGVTYEGIIMDPPVYGHGPTGKKWDFQKDFPLLLSLCSQLLSDRPLFVIVNAYAVSASAIMLENVFEDFFANKGTIESGELTIKEKSAGRLLSTGIFARVFFF